MGKAAYLASPDRKKNSKSSTSSFAKPEKSKSSSSSSKFSINFDMNLLSNEKKIKRTPITNDFYDIGNNYTYIHNSFINMQTMLSKNSYTLDSIYEEAFSKVKSVMLSIIDELIIDWQNLRQAFINDTIKKGMKTDDGSAVSTNPDKFLIEYNKFFKKLTQNKITGNLIELKKMGIEYKKGSAKNVVDIQKAFDLTTKLILDISNFYETQDKVWLTQITGETDKEFKKRMREAMPINQIIVRIKEALSSIGFKGDSIKEIQKFVNLLQKKELTDKQKEKLFVAVLENQFAAASGVLIEYSAMIETKENEFFKKIIGNNNSDIRQPWGKLFKDISVGDFFAGTTVYDNKDIKIMSSFKLTDKVSVERPYNIVEDLLEVSKIKDAGNLSFYNKVSWLRRNIASLSVMSRDVTALTAPLETKESKLQLLLLIPRILDGIYSFQEESMSPQYQGSRVHTALFFTKGEFFWMADILKKLKSLLENGKIEEGLASRKYTTNPIPVSNGDLEDIFQQKKNAIRFLAKEGKAINYINLYNEIDFTGINSKFKNWSPIKSITTIMKYQNLI